MQGIESAKTYVHVLYCAHVDDTTHFDHIVAILVRVDLRS